VLVSGSHPEDAWSYTYQIYQLLIIYALGDPCGLGDATDELHLVGLLLSIPGWLSSTPGLAHVGLSNRGCLCAYVGLGPALDLIHLVLYQFMNYSTLPPLPSGLASHQICPYLVGIVLLPLPARSSPPISRSRDRGATFRRVG
jgi:hypothetical protein